MDLIPRLLRGFGIVVLFLATAVAGTAGGVLFAFAGDLPEIEALDDYTPGVITRVIGRDGSIVGEFASERRQIIGYDDIPLVLRQAIMAAEDQDFETHGGIHPLLMAWAAVNDVVSTRRTPGRSTITQQLARQLFPESLGFERAWIRKIREALVAIQIEKRYTKEEIFTMYCNKVAWGYRTYGVEAASQLYFGKSARDLTLEEAATLAGMLPAPQRLNPYSNMEAALRRRAYTLDRMAEEGYITREEAEAAKARPIVTRGEPTPPPSLSRYFLDGIRTHLEQRYGAQAVDEGGLTVRTGLDPLLQTAANEALDAGLRRLDKLRGFRRPDRNLLDEELDPETWRHPRWPRELSTGVILPAVVLGVEQGDISIRIGAATGTIGTAGYRWTRRRAADLVRRGDIIEARILEIDEETGRFTAELEQPPEIQGAVVALENRTGQILAMVGGSDFSRSQFNRAVQAQRQVGSLFKPFVYAAAIDRGYTAESIIDDSPASFFAGPNQPPYQPRNYDHEYRGPITLRQALAQSRNVPAVRLMEALGPSQVIGYARRMGIQSPLPEYLSVAIGAAEANLLEITSAYSAFPNQGVRMEPLWLLEVLDRDGTVLEQHRPQAHVALRADTAYIMTSMLQSVVQNGTAVSAASLRWPLGGKTGTTDDYTDAWFIGFDPEITVGVWVGYDQKRTIGQGQTGTTAALPIWREIMAKWIEARRERGDVPEFERPGNVVTVETASGAEVFIAGTEPTADDPALPN
ncbi:MAG: PBP1A family penicillin-binding protein [Acidobacteriota bacterium]|nr:MAG: penicillin-binding protein [Acidobacteriota bacterium]